MKTAIPVGDAPLYREIDPELAKHAQEDLLALDKRLRSRNWRLNNLYWIEGEEDDGTRKVMRFRMNWAQAAFYKALWWLCCILKVRQLGFSTFIAIFGLDDTLFNQNHKFGIVDKTDVDAKKKLQKCRFAYDNLNRPDPENPELVALGATIKAARPLVPPTNEHTMTFGGDLKGAIWAGTNFRGDTAQVLHISELGYTAHYFPRKATELMAGATNAVHKGNHIFVESTFEGAKVGEFYDLIVTSMANNSVPDEELTEMDYRFFFYCWWKHPEYRLPGASIPTLEEWEKAYYDGLKNDHGIILRPEQIAWHIRKWRQQRDAMMKEFPSVPEDCLNASVQNAIYAHECMRARKDGRLQKINPDQRYGLIASWDLGFSDFMSIWIGQIVGAQIRWLRYYENTRETMATYVNWLKTVQDELGIQINQHYLPHDAAQHSRGGRTFVEDMHEAGITNVVVVPRTPDVWVGINVVRDLFPNMWFDTSTEYYWKKEGKNYIGGFASLENYSQQEETAQGVIRPVPIKNQSTHGADALRTFAEAYARGLVAPDVSGPPKTRTTMKPKVTGGPSQVLRGGVRSRRPKVNKPF